MPRPGRNDPCPCKSGKKYKKCCLARDLREETGSNNDRVSSTLDNISRFDGLSMGHHDLDDLSNHIVDLIHDRKLDEAEHLAQILLRQYPEVPDGFERLAAIAEARGQTQNALDLYQRALEFTLVHDGFEEEGRTFYRDKIEHLSLRLRDGPTSGM